MTELRRVDPILTVACALFSGIVARVAWAPVVALAVVAFAALCRRASLRVSIAVIAVALVAAVVGFRRADAALVAAVSRTAWARAALPHPDRCAFSGVIVTMPRVRGVPIADVEVRGLDCDGVVVSPVVGASSFRIRLYDVPADAGRGDVVEGVAQLALARNIQNEDLGDARIVAARQQIAFSGGVLVSTIERHGSGIVHAIDTIRTRLRAGLIAALPERERSVARALVLGEEDLSDDDAEAFRGSGLTHLLAVSGAHVALVVGGLVAALRALFLRVNAICRRIDPGRVAAIAGAALAPLYEQLSGDSGSARRATLMAIVLLLVRAAGRRPNVWRAFGASALAAVALDPLAPFDLSCALSLAATVGVLAIAPTLAHRWAPGRMFDALDPSKRSTRSKMRRAVVAAAATTVGATLACTPLIATINGDLPLLGVSANLIAVPLGEVVALPLANVVAVSAALVPASSRAIVLVRSLAWVLDGALVALRSVAELAAAPPIVRDFAHLPIPAPSSWQLAAIAAIGLVFYLYPPSRARPSVVASTGAAALLILEATCWSFGHPRGVLRVTILDVGQGDATLVDLPNGGAILVDGGGEVGSTFDPGAAIVAPVLAARRRSRLEVVVLSHPHPDHFSGLAAALGFGGTTSGASLRTRRATGVGAFWDTGQGEHDHGPGAYATLLAAMRARGVEVVRPDRLCGAAHALGGARVEVLHPCPRFDRDRGPNDNSLVVRIQFGARSVLLVGDAEHDAERDLVERAPDRLHADLLKVGHHGSRTSSTPAFIAAVAPSLAVISCGVRNRFGHPHASTLETFDRLRVPVHRTDVDGSLRWTTDGARVWTSVGRREAGADAASASPIGDLL